MKKLATCFAAAILLAAPVFAADPPDPNCWITYCDPPVFPPDPLPGGELCTPPPDGCLVPPTDECPLPPECDDGEL